MRRSISCKASAMLSTRSGCACCTLSWRKSVRDHSCQCHHENFLLSRTSLPCTRRPVSRPERQSSVQSHHQPPTQPGISQEIRLPNVPVDPSQPGKFETWTNAPRNPKQAATGRRVKRIGRDHGAAKPLNPGSRMASWRNDRDRRATRWHHSSPGGTVLT